MEQVKQFSARPSYVSVKSKLQHAPPSPPHTPGRAFDTFAVRSRKPDRYFRIKARDSLVSLADVFSIVTQRGGGALRDDTKNGCEGDEG